MKERFLCLGIRRAGMTTIVYMEDGEIVIKTAPSLQILFPRPLPKGAVSHG